VTDAIATLRHALPRDVACAIRVDGGPAFAIGTQPPRFTLILRTPRALAALAEPSMLALGEAFIEGTIDVEGDLVAAAETAHRMVGDDAVVANDATPRAPLTAHYDASNDFYALFLDRHMLYTCAYYERPDATLDEAQEAKLDLICRKLRLVPGERLLDIGCGWGGLVAWAAERYGVVAHGVTLSSAQKAWADDVLAARGLGGHASAEQRDYRDLPLDHPFDKIAAAGVIEHVGVAGYPAYFGRVRRLLAPGGLFLNQGITHTTTSPRTSGMAFLDRHVFPGGDLATIEHTTNQMRRAGLEVLHVEALGAHYVRTTRAWLERLTACRLEATALVGERAWRIWAGYLAASHVAFAEGWIDVHQVLVRRA
jgi:cyclopropane-fatty-acyl-phospholipid synthase